MREVKLKTMLRIGRSCITTPAMSPVQRMRARTPTTSRGASCQDCGAEAMRRAFADADAADADVAGALADVLDTMATGMARR